MKKFLSIVLIFILVSGLCFTGCGNSSEEVSDVSYKSVNIDNEDLTPEDFTKFYGAYILDSINIKNTVVLNDEPDSEYFLFVFRINNTSDSAFNAEQSFLASLEVNRKTYPLTIKSYKELVVEPSAKLTFIMYASVPDEAITEDGIYNIYFGYNNDFSVSEISKAENRFCYTGKTNQKGTAENVCDFETLKEYYQNEMSGYENLTVKDESSPEYGVDLIKVYDKNIIRQKSTSAGDNEPFEVTSNIDVLYHDDYNSIYDRNSSISLMFEVEGTDKDDINIHSDYYMEISSDAGLFSGNYSYSLSTFSFSSLYYDLSEIKKIVDGDNLKLTIFVKRSEDYVEQENLTKEGASPMVVFDCSEEMTETLRLYLSIVENMETEF